MGLFDKLINFPSSNEMQGNMGEYLTKIISHIDMPEALVIRDVLIDAKGDNTSQIDVLLIGERGIYVIEVKLYPGARIYGDGNKATWYYYRGGKKYNIYSPIMQNRNHIKYLKEFLKDFGDVPCFNVVALLCEDFKVENVNKDPNHIDTVILSGLLSLRKGIELIAKDKEFYFNEQTKQDVYNYIKTNQYIGKEKRKEHKERLIAKKEENLCPFCKSKLILRKGQYGDFYGCSAYPKCKYTKKVE